MKTINIFTNDQERSQLLALEVADKLTQRGFAVVRNASGPCDLNLCIGGDGAFLRAVHRSGFSDTPFVGINTGTLGFFQEILVPDVDHFLDLYEAGAYRVEELDYLEATIDLPNGLAYQHQALNEFTIKKDASSIVYIEVYIDGNHLQSFAGDALLVSTPSGSTAYNYSAGGSILYQALEGYQLTPVAPINSKAYRSLAHSLVLPRGSTLELVITSRQAADNFLLVVDGVPQTYDLGRMSFSLSDHHIKKLVFDDNWYWINIKDKFL